MLADFPAMLAQQIRQCAQRFVELRLQRLAQMACEHRRGAARGDRDLQRAALDDRRHLEARQLGIVDDIDQQSAGRTGHGDIAIDAAIIGGGVMTALDEGARKASSGEIPA